MVALGLAWVLLGRPIFSKAKDKKHPQENLLGSISSQGSMNGGQVLKLEDTKAHLEERQGKKGRGMDAYV